MKDRILLVALMAPVLMTGCAKGPGSESTNTKSEVGKPNASVKQSADKNKVAVESGAHEANDEKAELTQLNKGKSNIHLEQLPSDMLICTINNAPLTVGDYRAMFKLQQLQLESMVVSDPNVEKRMLMLAKQSKLSLTPAEKSKLLAAANGGKTSAQLQAFLKQKKMKQADFEQAIEDIGLALKAGNLMLEETLLNDLINRELLVQAAKAYGFDSKAMQHYLEIKHSPTYTQLVTATGLNGTEVKTEFLDTEMSKMMIKRIAERVTISDAEMQKFYDQHKAELQHPERIRLSQILIGAPQHDGDGVLSIKTQVERAYPKLTGKNLDAAVNVVNNKQHLLAQEVLVKAKNGQDFAQLANQNDATSKATKNGGDLGWYQKRQLIPQLANVVWPLKAGDVYPHLVESGLGYHILKVTGRQGAGTAPLSEVKPMIRAALMQQKGQEAVASWLKGQRKTVNVALSPKISTLLSQGLPKAGDGNTVH